MDRPTPADVHRRHSNVDDDVDPPHAPAHAATLRQFAFFPLHSEEVIDDPAARGRRAWADALESLAELAEDEEWTGATPTGRPLPILDSYLRYTYQRLVMEQKIAVTADAEYAAFNTGLLTTHAEEIFGLFQKNHVVDA